VDFLKDLIQRANLGNWDSWSTQYRILAVVVGLLVALSVLRIMVPAMLRLLRPALFLVVVLIAVWALYPAETCSIDLVAKLPGLCRR
jgi:multisubunit Na+/H+ antiporter MnhE subunit